MRGSTFVLLGAVLIYSQTVLAAPFREYPIGEPVARDGMKIAAVWLPVVQMEGMDMPLGEDVIHLEADIHAVKGNENGFGVGEWMPFLTVNYTLVHKKSGRKITGRLAPMVAKDGPHYGGTIQLPGKGRYSLKYEIRPPSENGFGRHSDPITGVGSWWKPFDVAFEFDFQGPR